jgi:hypothetical protein
VGSSFEGFCCPEEYRKKAVSVGSCVFLPFSFLLKTGAISTVSVLIRMVWQRRKRDN